MAGERFRVFVACGTGPRFTRLLDAVQPLLSLADVELFVQRGEAAADDLRLPGAPAISRAAFAERLAWADVVICHAGAGTLQQTASAGHLPWVMPRRVSHSEHVNDHQLELVRALSARGLALLLDGPLDRQRLGQARVARRTPSILCAPSLQFAVAACLQGTAPPRQPRWTGIARAGRSLWSRVRATHPALGDAP